MTMRAAMMVVIGVATADAVQAQGPPADSTGAVAARYVDPVNGLDLPRAIAQALEQEPSIRAARSGVEAARGLRVQAALRPNPMVSFSQQNEPGGMDQQTRIDVAWPLDLFRRPGRIGVADREVDAARALVGDRERLLAADVRTRFGEVAAAVRELTVLDDLFGAVSTQQALLAARVEQGAAPALERDMLRVERQRLEADRQLQSGVVERAMIALKRALGLPAGAPLRISATLEQLVSEAPASLPGAGGTQTQDPVNISNVWLRASAGRLPPALSFRLKAEATRTAGVDSFQGSQVRSDVAAADARVLATEAQVGLARREGRLDANVFAMYMRMDAGFPQRGFGAAGGLEPVRGVFHYVAAGVAVTVPLGDRNQGEIAAALARHSGATAERDAIRLTADAEVAAARIRDEHAARAVSAYASDVRLLARQNLAVVARTYELGRATVFDVLAEQRRYLDVERAFTSALREAYEARQALKQALGDLR